MTNHFGLQRYNIFQIYARKKFIFLKKAEGGKIERGKSWELLQTTILTIILFSRSLDSCHRSYVRCSLSKIINLLHARINIPTSGGDKGDGTPSSEGRESEGRERKPAGIAAGAETVAGGGKAYPIFKNLYPILGTEKMKCK